uniref:ATP synthase complex subunit 8 n=1 Tax=Palaeopropithecus ingens TaxID=1513477 RepID=A0A0A7DET5_9PRIM|nr:ATP synthase F0 subunit 8 [Palaeopropithecus ingens]AII98767.1 ATP synthase F0 subunit 8 [Palaeopropithecus ingens]
MPQLDTSTWLITILSMILTLFIIFQLKISKLNYPLNPELNITSEHKHANPWEMKWTKIYLPLSLPQQS